MTVQGLGFEDHASSILEQQRQPSSLRWEPPRQPSALYCWILEILYCDPKGRRALLRVPSTVGRSVCLCWALSKPKGPKELKCFLCSPFYGRACRWVMLGELKSKGSKKDPSPAPREDHPEVAPSESTALEDWVLKILGCNPGGRRAFVRILSTEGRGVGLCWEKLKPKGPKKAIGHLTDIRVSRRLTKSARGSVKYSSR